MASNLDRYKKDLERLLAKGQSLSFALEAECFPKEARATLAKQLDEGKIDSFLAGLPNFSKEYQAWYSEAKALIRQLLPDRLADFVRHYEKPKPRKDITYENYRIEDYLQGLTVTSGWERKKVVGPEAGVPHFRQQLAILQAVQARFESSLFDIRQLVQADLFDSELDAAEALLKAGHVRAAGALAGVVLEKHLLQVCSNHSVTIRKKSPTIGDLNEALKKDDVIDVPEWRRIQHLADVRNLCDHRKARDPKADEVQDLIAGVAKVTKTLF